MVRSRQHIEQILGYGAGRLLANIRRIHRETEQPYSPSPITVLGLAATILGLDPAKILIYPKSVCKQSCSLISIDIADAPLLSPPPSPPMSPLLSEPPEVPREERI